MQLISMTSVSTCISRVSRREIWSRSSKRCRATRFVGWCGIEAVWEDRLGVAPPPSVDLTSPSEFAVQRDSAMRRAHSIWDRRFEPKKQKRELTFALFDFKTLELTRAYRAPSESYPSERSRRSAPALCRL